MWQLLMLAVLCGVLSGLPAHAVELSRTETSAGIEVSEISSALSRGTVLARLDAGETLSLLAGEVSAQEDATLYVAASSEFMSVAVLRGTATVDGTRGDAGHVFVRAISGSRTERFTFDAQAFSAAAPGSLTAGERDSLAAIAARQEERIFWGSLERTGFDAQSPAGDPMTEAVRRDYLLRPAVMAVRSTAQGDPQVLAREAAGRFVAGLAARDAATVEALLSPTLFAEGGRDQVEWLNARRAFARELVAGEMPAVVAGTVIGEGSIEEGFVLDRNGDPWRVQVQPLDSMVFVTALEPTPTTTEKKP